MGATSFVFIVALVSPAFSQTKDIKLPSSNSPDTKIFSTGNSAIDGGIIGLGLGALGAAVLGPTLNQAVSAPQTGCGRRKRQADGEERFFLPSGGSCTCGRKKRQVAGDNRAQPDTKFFGLFGNNNNQHCGSCCYNQGFNAGASQGGFSQGSTGLCQCDYSKTFNDQYGNTHGACRRADNSGRTWCYTTGWGNSGCGDLQSSSRFPNNPWSYRACSSSG